MKIETILSLSDNVNLQHSNPATSIALIVLHDVTIQAALSDTMSLPDMAALCLGQGLLEVVHV